MENIGITDFIGLDCEYQDITEGRDWMDCPEQRLVWAVIERSVRDALGNQISDIMTAIDWLWRPEQSAPEIFSFQWCCETLGVAAKDLRLKVLRLREQLQKSPLQLPCNSTNCQRQDLAAA